MSAHYRARRRLRFADCDPAGIAYYPRYLEMCDGVVEDWCEDVLQVPRRVMHLELARGMPTVRIEAEFTAPSHLGDWLGFTLEVTSLGRSSIGLRIVAACDGETRFTIDYVQVLVDVKTNRSLPWPDPWRRRIEGGGIGAP